MVALLATIALAAAAPGSARVLKQALPAASALQGMQYLYGSAESAAASHQAWNALVRYVALVARDRPTSSVVLAEASTLAAPHFVPCDKKPLAAVFDVDETVLLNEGFEYDELTGAPGRPLDPRWRRWEHDGIHRVTPTPGARDALSAIRALGVTVVFNTNRDADMALDTERALDDAGLGPAEHKNTLFLKGDDDTGSLKDVRRKWIADRFCVVAMGGDQLGDFSDRFNHPGPVKARRARADLPGIAGLWGNGWFVLPNPVYGTAVQGGARDIFPKDKQWRDPGPDAPKEPKR